MNDLDKALIFILVKDCACAVFAAIVYKDNFFVLICLGEQ